MCTDFHWTSIVSLLLIRVWKADKQSWERTQCFLIMSSELYWYWRKLNTLDQPNAAVRKRRLCPFRNACGMVAVWLDAVQAWYSWGDCLLQTWFVSSILLLTKIVWLLRGCFKELNLMFHAATIISSRWSSLETQVSESRTCWQDSHAMSSAWNPSPQLV